MKKFSIFILLILFSAFLWSCSHSSDKPGAATKKIIHGTAAKGAYFPEGSIVELRPAPTLTGNQITVGYNPDGSAYVVDEYTPSTVLSSAVVGNEGGYEIDVTGYSGPYIIRVQDSSTLKWYYSYGDETITTANINPYTDWMVQNYYFGIWGENINECFSRGTFLTWGYGDNAGADITFVKSSYGLDKTKVMWYGMSMPIPEDATIQRIMRQLQYTMNIRYSIDIGNVLTGVWVIGEDYDTILDTTIIDQAYITRTLANMCFTDDMMDHGIAYYDTTAGTIHVELWSPYAYCKIMEQNGNGLLDVTDSNPENGLYHYVYDGAYVTKPLDETIKISDEVMTTPDPGFAFSIVTYDL